MWPALQTQLDIACAVALLSCYLTNPTQEHVDAAPRVPRYMVDTRTLGIQYSHGHDRGSEAGRSLQGFVDAARADDLDTRRSTGGFCFFYHSGPIYWKAARQPIVVLSSTAGAEYIAITTATKEAIALGRFFEECVLKMSVWRRWTNMPL